MARAKDESLDAARTRLLGVAMGITGNVLLFRFRRPVGWLAWVGHYSFPIYLFHVFWSAGSRILLTRLHLSAPLVIFSGGLLFAVLCSVATAELLSRHRVLCPLFLGQRWEADPRSQPYLASAA